LIDEFASAYNGLPIGVKDGINATLAANGTTFTHRGLAA
jgi:hypothetical protein